MDSRIGMWGVAVALGAAIGCDGRSLMPTSGGQADEVPACGLGISLTEIPVQVGNAPVQPLAITAGPDRNLWITEVYIWYVNGSNVGCATSKGRFHEFAIPSGGSAFAIAAGPDGALWFTEPTFDHVGRISFN